MLKAMTKTIITGATGNAGSAILTAALSSSSISHITVLSRRAPYVTDPEISTILIPSDAYPKGFDEFPSGLVEKVKDHQAIIWGLGVSQTQVNKDDYVKITHDYTLTAAKALSTLGTTSNPFKFIYISGEGADQSERGWTLFGRIKGRTEKALKALETESFKTISLRPGAINPTEEYAPRMGVLRRWSLNGFSALAKVVYPGMVIDAAELGDVCVQLALGDEGWDMRDGEGWVPNTGLKKMLKDFRKV